MGTIADDGPPVGRAASRGSWYAGTARARVGGGGPDARHGLFTRVIETLLLWQTRAMQRRRLQELDDRLLRDVGLSRADVEHEAAKPFWRK